MIEGIKCELQTPLLTSCTVVFSKYMALSYVPSAGQVMY